jgi:hypothetical protein
MIGPAECEHDGEKTGCDGYPSVVQPPFKSWICRSSDASGREEDIYACEGCEQCQQQYESHHEQFQVTCFVCPFPGMEQSEQFVKCCTFVINGIYETVLCGFHIDPDTIFSVESDFVDRKDLVDISILFIERGDYFGLQSFCDLIFPFYEFGGGLTAVVIRLYIF